MKKLGKILALILALMMAITAFGACKKAEEDKGYDITIENKSEDAKDNKDTKEDKELTDEEQIEENVGNFYKSLLAFDIDKMEKYTKPGSNVTEKILESAGYQDMTATFEMFGLSEEESAEIIELIFENFKYKVSDIKINGDKAEVIVDLSAPDFDLLGEKTSEYQDVSLQLIAKELGFKSVDDLQAAAQSGAVTEDQVMEAMGSVFAELMKLAVEDIKKEPYKESKEQVFLEKIKGVWYIAG